MQVEIYDRARGSGIRGGQLEKVIAHHVDVQAKLATHAAKGERVARAELSRLKSRAQREYVTEKWKSRARETEVYTTVAKVDHHVGLEGYVEVRDDEPKATRRMYEILMKTLRGF